MTTMTGFENLANAIVIQAAKDYTKALKMHKKHPHYDVAKTQIAELEDFFRSPWYRTLTSVDGEMLIKKLREGVQ